MKFKEGDIVFVPVVIKHAWCGSGAYHIELLNSDKLNFPTQAELERYAVKAELTVSELPTVTVEATNGN